VNCPSIDTNDCSYSLRIGGGVKRSLIRHFTARLHEAIRDAGADPADAALIDQEVVDRHAWDLAENAIDAAMLDIYDYLDDVIHLNMVAAPERLSECLEAVANNTWNEFAGDGLQLPLFLQLASDAPPDRLPTTNGPMA
jgi:hypothetical protein